MKIPEIIPVTDLRQDAAAVLKRLQASDGPLVVTQRGRAVAVMQTLEAYERTRQEHEMLRLLAAGEKELAVGKGHDLTDVLKDADSLLEDDDS